MTWATIHYLTDSTMAVEFPFSQRHKTAIAQMTGAEFDGATKRWDVPVARLGDVVKLFWPNVTIDYAVLCARDEQLQAMFRGYRDMGVRFDVVAGKVVCDHAMLNDWFAEHSTALHVNALLAVDGAKKGDAKPTERPMPHSRSYPTPMTLSPNGDTPVKPSEALLTPKAIQRDAKNADLAIWLQATQNAARREEAKADMLRRKRSNI